MALTPFQVDGKPVQIDSDPQMPLLYALRDDLKMNNPKFGCGLAQCGACTVHINGQAVRSCVMPVSAVKGKKVTTLAGLGTPEKPHPIQVAFLEERTKLKIIDVNSKGVRTIHNGENNFSYADGDQEF